MKRADFTHLNIHTCYSFGESVLKIDDLVEQAKKMGYHSLAVTDINNLCSCMDFYYKALSNGIKPIIGAELTFDCGNLVLLCKDEKGFSNLNALVSIKDEKDNFEIDELIKRKNGLIVLTGNVNSLTFTLLKEDKLTDLEKWLKYLKSEFEDDLYVQLNCDYENRSIAFMHILEGIAENLEIKTVLANCVKYLNSSHYKILDAFKCILSGEDYYSSDRKRVNNDQNYLKSSEEMKETGFLTAYKNTMEVSKRCNVLFKENIFLPKYDIPDSFKNSKEYLLYLTSNMLEKKYKEDELIFARKRLNNELSIISSLGYEDYFLMVWDIIKYAKEHNITIGPGRGSSVSSITAYLLNINEIDPLKYDLIFERFLNPDRKEFPDIDVDVCSEKRERLIKYVRKRFGKKNVAHIISFGTFKASLAIREIGKTLGAPQAVIENIMSYIDKRKDIESNVKQNKELRRLINRSPQVKKVIIGAQKLEGIIRNKSQHAAGLVIFPEKLLGNIPYFIEDNKTISQWDKDSLQKYGALKFDLLSLRTLSTIDRIMNRIRKKNINIDHNDINIYNMISEGYTSGIFQLETHNMTKYAMLLKPENFEELCILSAVVRPGARDNFDLILKNRNNKKDFHKYENKKIREILKNTFGIIIYQEQIMKLAQIVAGFDAQKSDYFRQAITKKDIYIMRSLREDFLSGAKKNGFKHEIASEVFDDIVKFAGYGFNKAHATAYTAISLKCAYLKYYYPFAFYTELLNSEIDSIEKINNTVKELKERGIKILAPHLLKSKSRFAGTTKGIRFAFSGIKGIGFTQGKALENFVRSFNKKIEDYDEFLFKLNNVNIAKNVIVSLIYTGACDFFGKTRKYMIENLENDISYNSLFETSTKEDADSDEYDINYLREKEKEYMGFSFTYSKIDDFSLTMKLLSEEKIIEACRIKEKELKVCGIISNIEHDIYSENNKFVFTLEDYSGSIEITTYRDDLELIQKNTVVQCDIRGSHNGYILKSVRTIENIFSDPKLKLVIKIDNIEKLEMLKDIFEIYQGEHEIMILMSTEEGKVLLETENMIQINEILLEEIEEIIGIENMQLRF